MSERVLNGKELWAGRISVVAIGALVVGLAAFMLNHTQRPAHDVALERQTQTDRQIRQLSQRIESEFHRIDDRQDELNKHLQLIELRLAVLSNSPSTKAGVEKIEKLLESLIDSEKDREDP